MIQPPFRTNAMFEIIGVLPRDCQSAGEAETGDGQLRHAKGGRHQSRPCDVAELGIVAAAIVDSAGPIFDILGSASNRANAPCYPAYGAAGKLTHKRMEKTWATVTDNAKNRRNRSNRLNLARPFVRKDSVFMTFGADFI
jgi:hypothetical protein